MADPRLLSAELASELIPLMAAPGYLDAISAAGRAVETTEPEAVKQPMLLLWGDKDRLVPVSAAEEMLRRAPDARLVKLPGIGHSPMIEVPGETAKQILEFTAP
jgi:pimeloyl-ACP methyl ester carboxylesterase